MAYATEEHRREEAKSRFQQFQAAHPDVQLPPELIDKLRSHMIGQGRNRAFEQLLEVVGQGGNRFDTPAVPVRPERELRPHAPEEPLPSGATRPQSRRPRMAVDPQLSAESDALRTSAQRLISRRQSLETSKSNLEARVNSHNSNPPDRTNAQAVQQYNARAVALNREITSLQQAIGSYNAARQTHLDHVSRFQQRVRQLAAN